MNRIQLTYSKPHRYIFVNSVIGIPVSYKKGHFSTNCLIRVSKFQDGGR